MRYVPVLLFAAAGLALAPSASEAQKKRRDLITREEIQSSGQKDQDILAAIRALRPHFLEGPRGVRSLGNTMIMPTIVVVDRVRATGLDALERIMAADVAEVRYLEPSRSQDEYGITANGGAIVLKLLNTKKDP